MLNLFTHKKALFNNISVLIFLPPRRRCSQMLLQNKASVLINVRLWGGACTYVAKCDVVRVAVSRPERYAPEAGRQELSGLTVNTTRWPPLWATGAGMVSVAGLGGFSLFLVDIFF